jgi:hypothetical protein
MNRPSSPGLSLQAALFVSFFVACTEDRGRNVGFSSNQWRYNSEDRILYSVRRNNESHNDWLGIYVSISFKD